MVSGIDRLGGRINLAKIAAKSLFNIAKTGLNIGLCPLKECLNRSIGAVFHITGQIISACRSMRGIAKSHALHPAFENDFLGNLIHGCILESFSFGRNKKGETALTVSPVIFFASASLTFLLELTQNVVGDFEVAKHATNNPSGANGKIKTPYAK